MVIYKRGNPTRKLTYGKRSGLPSDQKHCKLKQPGIAIFHLLHYQEVKQDHSLVASSNRAAKLWPLSPLHWNRSCWRFTVMVSALLFLRFAYKNVAVKTRRKHLGCRRPCMPIFLSCSYPKTSKGSFNFLLLFIWDLVSQAAKALGERRKTHPSILWLP